MRKVFHAPPRITARFQAYNHRLWSFTGGYHSGLDMVPTAGSWDLLSVIDGQVNSITPNGTGLGRTVQVYSRALGLAVRYAHLASVTVKPGKIVSVGDNLGVMGGSGHGKEDAFAPHVHIDCFFTKPTGERSGIINGSTWRNPWGYVDPEAVFRLLGVML